MGYVEIGRHGAAYSACSLRVGVDHTAKRRGQAYPPMLGALSQDDCRYAGQGRTHPLTPDEDGMNRAPSGRVTLDPDFPLREVDGPGGPDLDRVDPGVLRVAGRQLHVLPQLQYRCLAQGDAVGRESDLLPVVSRDLGVDVELKAAVGA